MEISPLQLKSYAFSDVLITAQDNPNNSDLNKIEGEQTFGVCPDNKRNWHASLTVKLNANEGEKPPYLGRIKIEGFFRVHEEWPEDRIEALVSSNAPALLYGAIREMFAPLTSRSKHGLIYLNTVRFPPQEINKEMKKIIRSTRSNRSSAPTTTVS